MPRPVPPQVYERRPGDACAPLPPGYRRREPEKTVLFQVVAEHLETFLQEARDRTEHGFGLPGFVEREFRDYLKCGILCHGFARCRCRNCGDELFVALSCQGRTVCPSCTARRMADTAAHLVDRVLPASVRYRQWVLSFPRRVRMQLVRDPDLLSWVLRTFARRVFAWQRQRAREQGLVAPRTGAVVWIQRFASNLALNPHFHGVFPDGVFVEPPAGSLDNRLRFVPLEPPTDEEVSRILLSIARRAEKRLARLAEDAEPEAADCIGLLRATSVLDRPPAADRDSAPTPMVRSRRCAFIQGYSLHANRHTNPRDTENLEQLCRYAGRGALATERLQRTGDGRLSYRVKHHAPGAPAKVILEPTELLRKLAALVPPPRRHQLRYLGVFSSHSQDRARVIPPVPVEVAALDDSSPRGRAKPADPALLQAPVFDPLAPREPASVLERRLDWASLIQRVFKQDVLVCTSCGGPRQVIAFLTDPPVVGRILEHLELPTTPPAIAPARAPPQPSFDDWLDETYADPPASDWPAS